MTSIDPDLEIIANSLRMLPPWDWDQPHSWWARYSELSAQAGTQGKAHDRAYLTEKLSWVATDRPEDGAPGCTDLARAHERAIYVLMLFDIDHPPLHEHLDTVQATFIPVTAGTTGRRWAQHLCAAAWRVITATERADYHSNNFAAPHYP